MHHTGVCLLSHEHHSSYKLTIKILVVCKELFVREKAQGNHGGSALVEEACQIIDGERPAPVFVMSTTKLARELYQEFDLVPFKGKAEDLRMIREKQG